MLAGDGEGEPIFDNQIKVIMDGDRLQVIAKVDVKGARKLLRVIQANLALLADDEEDEE